MTKIRAWHFGNTTIRNPYRLREGLSVLKNSEFNGNLIGEKNEAGFATLLNVKGVVNSNSKKELDSLGRKWRAALSQLGFIVHHEAVAKLSLAEKENTITPIGLLLVNAEEVLAQQECFLRAFLSYKIPSLIERHTYNEFYPLRFVLSVLRELEEEGIEAFLSFDEIQNIIQINSPETLKEVVNEIQITRSQKDSSTSKRSFTKSFNDSVSKKTGIKIETLRDYADTNLRYLQATGLFKRKGRGIILSEDKKELVNKILEKPSEKLNDRDYFFQLWKGAKLPYDEKETALSFIRTLASSYKRLSSEGFPLENIDEKTPAELSQIRIQIEEKIKEAEEISFAVRQVECKDEILDYMKALLERKRTTLFRSDEAPAYLEWTLWRAFLAINHLKNKPWEARFFKVDQDFLPIYTAPSRVPDLLFEFEDFVLVVEVTLSQSSRQEAMEGEPVRRHVAEKVEQFKEQGKDVYGIFIAINIDSNTAETFRMGNWYTKNDEKLALRIVPISLGDFFSLFANLLPQEELNPQYIKNLLIQCRAESNLDAPEWKQKINKIIELKLKK